MKWKNSPLDHWGISHPVFWRAMLKVQQEGKNLTNPVSTWPTIGLTSRGLSVPTLKKNNTQVGGVSSNYCALPSQHLIRPRCIRTQRSEGNTCSFNTPLHVVPPSEENVTEVCRRTYLGCTLSMNAVRVNVPCRGFHLLPAQVAKFCGKLPLALNMAGRLGREDPLQPASWRGVLKKLQDKYKMFKNEQVSDNGGVLFPVINATFDMLPRRQKEQFKMVVVVAAGVPISTDMMANLWGEVRACFIVDNVVTEPTVQQTHTTRDLHAVEGIYSDIINVANTTR